MNFEIGYLERCLALCHRADRNMENSAGPLIDFCLFRLAKIGRIAGYEADWQALTAKQLADLAVIPENSVSDTTGFKWMVNPGAAWLAARGNTGLTDEVISAVKRMISEGHRNSDGLFDNPAMPGHLSTEVLAMTVPVLAWAGKCSGDNSFFDEAIRQIEGYSSMLYDQELRLWHPGYLPGRADKTMWNYHQRTTLEHDLYFRETGVFPGYWGRGEGYVLFAVSELVYELPDEHPAKDGLLKFREQMLEALLQYQDPNGMWHQVINDWGSYPETSGTAWILYAMGRALKGGKIDRRNYLVPYMRGLAGLGRYIAWDGSYFNCSGGRRSNYRGGVFCPGGRGTSVDYALQMWDKDEPRGFVPIVLALQQAAQLEHNVKLIPSYQEVLEMFPGDEQ